MGMFKYNRTLNYLWQKVLNLSWILSKLCSTSGSSYYILWQIALSPAWESAGVFFKQLCTELLGLPKESNKLGKRGTSLRLLLSTRWSSRLFAGQRGKLRLNWCSGTNRDPVLHRLSTRLNVSDFVLEPDFFFLFFFPLKYVCFYMVVFAEILPFLYNWVF